MNLSHEQRMLIQDIFNVRVTRQKGNSDSMILLENFVQQVARLGPNASLVDHSTYYDSLLMQILSKPNVDILQYLEECLRRCYNILQKPWNQNPLAQNFIKYSQEIIKNFIYLTQTQFQIFPNQLIIDPQSTKITDLSLSIAMRLMTHFQRKNFNIQLFNVFYPKLNQQSRGDFSQSFLQVLIARQQFQTILDTKAYFYISTLQTLTNISQIKQKLLKMKKKPFQYTQLTKIQGANIDRQSSLGLFLRMSILGHNPGPYYQQNQSIKKFMDKITDQLGKDKFRKDRVKYYTDLQNQFYAKFISLYKIFFKKQSQKQFLLWNYSIIYGNLGRAKLASRLQSARNFNLSHDGFMINTYVSMLNLCKPIFNIQSNKYTSINPQYYMYNQRVKLCKYQKINKKQTKLNKKNIEFGTITQFFFLALELLYVGVIPTQDNFVEQMENKQRLLKMRDKTPLNHPMRHKLQEQLTRLKSHTVLLFLVLMEQNIINPTIKLFDLLLFLLPNWLGIRYQQLQDCKFIKKYQPNPLIYHLPQHFLSSIHKFHTGTYRFKDNYLTLVGQKHIHQLLNLTCLILSQQGIVTNPYIGADFLQLIFLFLLQNKTGIMQQTLKTNTVCYKNLTYGLMKFYCDIAVTGSSHQFYSKFKYRQFVNKIFMTLWQYQHYRDKLKSYFKTETFQKFLNMIIRDTTYCFDQTNQKFASYQQLESKSQNNKLTQQQDRNLQNLSLNIQATMNQSTSNIKLLKQLSKWSPQTFFSQAFLGDIVHLLSNILQTFVDPTTFVANRQFILKYKFQKDHVLSNIVEIFVHLDISQKLASQIVKDTRYYKKQHFIKALQRASNEGQTDVSILQRFQQLIKKLQNTISQQQDQQIYGQIPDKYLCSLMSTLMKDPVKLPSGYVVDRVYIHKHILNDQRDPFTRKPLKNGQWEQLTKLKQEIAAWKKKRLPEIKGGNKAVKYGKIGQNKKQEQIQSLYSGQKIIKFDEDDN